MIDDAGRLPSAWTWTTLGDLAEITGGLTKGKKRRPSDRLRQVPYLRVANVQRGYLDLTEVKTIEATESELAALRLQPGDVLLNEGGDRDKLGRGWIWQGAIPDCIHQNHVFRARLHDGALLPKILSWWANSAGQSYFLKGGKQTTNLASINMTVLRALPVPVPPPPEQHRIVEAIESYFTRLDDAVATLKRVQRNIERYRASVLKAAVEGRLVPTEADLAKAEGRDYEPAAVLLERILAERRRRWEEAELAKMKAQGKPPMNDKWKAKYKEPAEPDTSELPDLPEGWCWSTWERVSERVTVGHVGKMKDEYVDRGTPFLRSQNVRVNRFDPSGLRYISESFHNRLSKSRIEPHDLLVVRSGVNFGMACAVPTTLPEANCADLVVIKQPRGVLPSFGAYYLNSMAKAGIAARHVGAAIPHFNTKSVATFPVPVPPLSEQIRIVARLDQLISIADESDATCAATLSRVERLRQSILKTAFEGKLVEQDPSDEPADVLLERIKTEREAAASTRPSRRPSGRKRATA